MRNVLKIEFTNAEIDIPYPSMLFAKRKIVNAFRLISII